MSTNFDFLVTGCVDVNYPLTYRYAYYLSDDHLQEDIYTATTLNINYLTDFISLNEQVSILPGPLNIDLANDSN